MLKYTVKPSKDTELIGFPIKELFVSSDLQYISGVTDYNVGLVNGEEILIKSPYIIGNEINTINLQTVKRQGKVKVSIELPVKTITMPLNFPIYSDNEGKSYILAYNEKNIINDIEGDYVLSSITQNYVEYRGDISYFFNSENTSGYLIDHKFYTATKDSKSVIITTFLYIEDGKLQVGDYTYYADFSDSSKAPELKINKESKPIKENDVIGLIDGCECKFTSIMDYVPKKWERVNKFSIIKHNNPVLNVEDVLYGGYKHYVTFNDENYYFRDVYLYDEEQGKDVYMGYGILLNGFFYNANDTSLNNEFHDLEYGETALNIVQYGETLEIHDTLISPTNGGCFLIIIGIDEGNDIIPGNYLIAESNSPIDLIRVVETDENNDEYVEFLGKKYLIEDRVYDTVNISGENYLLTYLNEDYTSASTMINGETIYLNVEENIDENGRGEAKLSNKIYYRGSESTDKLIKIKYGISEDSYTVSTASGVTINGNRYEVIVDERETIDEETIEYKYVTISENVKIPLEVRDINGSSSYIAYPVIDDETIDEISANYLQREYCNIIVNNWKSFTFTVRKDTFGSKPLTVENGLMSSMASSFPYTISDAYLLENKIEIFRIQNYLSFKFPLLNKTANNIRREEIIKNDFVNYIKEESINTIVDMEKDIYYPVWKDNDNFNPIQQIRFNLHFRTRNFDNWKIYEDDREFKDIDTPNSLRSNWFVTDLNYYNINEFTDVKKKLHNSSDLLGFINFTTDDVRYQSTKLSKSFLRLSFYSTNDPKTQVLLATSTIFFDENLAYKKYINSKRNSDMIYVDAKFMEQAGYSSFTEYQASVSAGTAEYQVSSNTISVSSEVYKDTFFNDESRLSSRFVVNDKYNTDTSSEGYYLYIFKDYSKKLHEETIYMKVDFNHAGIGKTVSFMLPRKIGAGDTDGSNAELLYLDKANDLKTLKNGFRLTDIYKQTHIPIKIKFDDKTNKYVYYLPDNLRENGHLNVDNEIMEFNLFEVKFANESIEI